MRGFVTGSNEQFSNLKNLLQDEMCHVFHNCALPSCCSKSVCRIGFEKSAGTYVLLIDSGITCSKRNGSVTMALFKQWLSAGELLFLDFNDLKEFLQSLTILY